jgi:hypothetical protein
VTDRIRLDDMNSDHLDRLSLMVDEYAAGARTLSEQLGQAQARAEQAEDLLRVAHETSNRSEAERARAAQRAEEAQAALERVRERCQGVRGRSGPGGMINATQILGLLSPTWPDGNYEAPAPADALNCAEQPASSRAQQDGTAS